MQKIQITLFFFCLSALAIDDDIEKTEGERLDIFEKFVKSKLILGIETEATLEVKDEKEIVTEAERYDDFLIFLETLLRLPFYQRI